MKFLNKNSAFRYLNTRFEKSISHSCKKLGIDDKTKLELVELIDETLQGDVLQELRTALANEVFYAIDEDDNWVSLKDTISWDDVYDIIDEYVGFDWRPIYSKNFKLLMQTSTPEIKAGLNQKELGPAIIEPLHA